jgi:hypothetical protein
MLLTTTDIVDDSHGDHLRSLNAAPFRHEQREDDAFRNEKVARAVAMLPPSVDDERWATHAVAFAVSILVFLLRTFTGGPMSAAASNLAGHRRRANAAMGSRELVLLVRVILVLVSSLLDEHLSSTSMDTMPR